MIPLRAAIRMWEEPFGDEMIGYASITQKASISPSAIFVVYHWDPVRGMYVYRGCDVGLRKHMNKWIVNDELFKKALNEKRLSRRDTRRWRRLWQERDIR